LIIISNQPTIETQDWRNEVDISEDEGKRYVNPDGGVPLYEDELTEDEKEEFEEVSQ
jgi:hypothetical protein